MDGLWNGRESTEIVQPRSCVSHARQLELDAVEQLPPGGYPTYFGIAMPPDGAQFGLHDGTSLRQHGWIESNRAVLSKNFGTRIDQEGADLGPRITAGTRLAVQRLATTVVAQSASS